MKAGGADPNQHKIEKLAKAVLTLRGAGRFLDLEETVVPAVAGLGLSTRDKRATTGLGAG